MLTPDRNLAAWILRDSSNILYQQCTAIRAGAELAAIKKESCGIDLSLFYEPGEKTKLRFWAHGNSCEGSVLAAWILNSYFSLRDPLTFARLTNWDSRAIAKAERPTLFACITNNRVWAYFDELIAQAAWKVYLEGHAKNSIPLNRFVALSGGVDSTVVASMVSDFFVPFGLTVKHLPDNEDERSCCSTSALNRVREFCHENNFPHLTLYVEGEFRERIIEPWKDARKEGRSTNPCVDCNGTFRFHHMFGVMDEISQENNSLLYTGHYVKQVVGKEKGIGWHGEPVSKLLPHPDATKDQTYMLSTVPDNLLDRMRFPMGGFPNKGAVRAYAASRGLPEAVKRDSTGLCFLAGRKVKEFMADEGEELKYDVYYPDDTIEQGVSRGFSLGQKYGGLWVKEIKGDKVVLAHSPPERQWEIIISKGMDTFVFAGPRESCWRNVQSRYHSGTRKVSFVYVAGKTISTEFAEGDFAPGQTVTFLDSEGSVTAVGEVV